MNRGLWKYFIAIAILLSAQATPLIRADIILQRGTYSENSTTFPLGDSSNLAMWKWTRTADKELFDSTSTDAAKRPGLAKASKFWSLTLISEKLEANKPKKLHVFGEHLIGPHKEDKNPGGPFVEEFGPFTGAAKLRGAAQRRHETTNAEKPHYDLYRWKVDAPAMGDVCIGLSGLHLGGPIAFNWSFRPLKPGTLTGLGSYGGVDDEVQFEKMYSTDDVKKIDRLEAPVPKGGVKPSKLTEEAKLDETGPEKPERSELLNVLACEPAFEPGGMLEVSRCKPMIRKCNGYRLLQRSDVRPQ